MVHRGIIYPKQILVPNFGGKPRNYEAKITEQDFSNDKTTFPVVILFTVLISFFTIEYF